MSDIRAELEEMMHQKGYEPYVFDLRGDEVYIRHIVSGGIDNPVYGYIRMGTVDEARQELQAKPKHEPPKPGYCSRCCSSSSNLNVHNCQYIFTFRAEQACSDGDFDKITEIIETAQSQGIELLGNWWKDYYHSKKK